MSWKEALPEKVREWDEVKNAETAEDFFNQVAELRSSIGQSIRVPGEDASDEARNAFYGKLTEKVPGLVRLPGEDDEEGFNNLYKRLGAPESIDGYEFEGDDPMVGIIKETALKSKLTKKQFKAITERILGVGKEAKETSKEKHEADIAGLKLKWGEAYEQKLATAELVRKQYFPFAPEGEALGVQSIEAFAKLGEQMSGESKGFETSGEAQGSMTPGEAQLQISEIMNNKEHPYWNRRDPAHGAAREKMSRLNAMAYPG